MSKSVFVVFFSREQCVKAYQQTQFQAGKTCILIFSHCFLFFCGQHLDPTHVHTIPKAVTSRVMTERGVCSKYPICFHLDCSLYIIRLFSNEASQLWLPSKCLITPSRSQPYYRLSSQSKCKICAFPI